MPFLPVPDRGSWQGPEEPSTAVLPGVLIDREPGQVLKVRLRAVNVILRMLTPPLTWHPLMHPHSVLSHSTRLQEHLTKSNESIRVVMFERASPPWGFALDGYAPTH